LKETLITFHFSLHPASLTFHFSLFTYCQGGDFIVNSNSLFNEKCRLGMVADDLTGACDTGGQFARWGFSTRIWLNFDLLDFDKLNPVEGMPTDLTVVTTNSRSDSPDQARRKVQQACQRLAQNQIVIFYKKIDSTLRGNVGVEVEAVLETCGFPLANSPAPAEQPLRRPPSSLYFTRWMGCLTRRTPPNRRYGGRIGRH
jgi:hypothetical protein